MLHLTHGRYWHRTFIDMHERAGRSIKCLERRKTVSQHLRDSDKDLQQLYRTDQEISKATMYLGNTLIFFAVLLYALKQCDCAAWHPSEDKANDKSGKGKGSIKFLFFPLVLSFFCSVIMSQRRKTDWVIEPHSKLLSL